MRIDGLLKLMAEKGASDLFLRAQAPAHVRIDGRLQVIDQKVITKDEIIFYASMPTRDVLYARLAGALISPMAKLAWVLKEMSEAQKSKSAGESAAEN